MSSDDHLSREHDDWDYSYKLEGGRLISSHLYSNKNTSRSPTLTHQKPRRGRSSSRATSHHPPRLSLEKLPTGYTNSKCQQTGGVSKFSDPDPEIPIVDAKDDEEFVATLHSSPAPVTLTNLENQPVFVARPPSSAKRIKLLKERIQQELTSTNLSDESVNQGVRCRKETRNPKPIEEVIRETSIREESETSVCSLPSITDESEMGKDMSTDRTLHEVEIIRLYSYEGKEPVVVTRQVIALSGILKRMAEEDGFDGNLVLSEADASMKLLGAWLTRDREFEVTRDNCEHLLRIATQYEIPRLEKDVIPHLLNLHLNSFDAFTYGHLYSIPIMTRQHELYVLDHFDEYVATHLKKLMINSPDNAIDLVKKYVEHSSVGTPSAIIDNTRSAGNKFKAWLAAEDPPYGSLQKTNL